MKFLFTLYPFLIYGNEKWGCDNFMSMGNGTKLGGEFNLTQKENLLEFDLYNVPIIMNSRNNSSSYNYNIYVSQSGIVHVYFF